MPARQIEGHKGITIHMFWQRAGVGENPANIDLGNGKLTTDDDASLAK